MAEAGAEDKELDELLESALDDFEKTGQPVPSSDKAAQPAGPERPPADAAKDELFSSQERFFQELFSSELAAQATEEFEKAMKELAAEEPHLVEQFQKLSQAAGNVGSDESSQQEFTSCLKETLSGLAKNANDLQNPSLSEEELARAMEGLGMDEAEGEGNILPFMQNIMQNLLSKEVLYPSLKEITDKYPEWLQSHRDTLPPQEHQRYQEQHNLMSRICQKFESEQPGEEAARFEAIMDLMQQSPGLNFDMEGLNLNSGSASGEQCAIM